MRKPTVLAAVVLLALVAEPLSSTCAELGNAWVPVFSPQGRLDWRESEDRSADPLDSKERARARFEVPHADVPALERAKLAAAQGEVKCRFREFLAGRGTLDILLEASQRWLDATHAVHRDPASQVAAFEQYWILAKLIEEVKQGRHKLGSIAIQDYLQSRHHRLVAAIQLAQARANQGKPGGTVSTLPRLAAEEDRLGFKAWSHKKPESWEPKIPGFSPSPVFDVRSYLATAPKEIAKAKFEAAQTDVGELQRARLEAARGQAEARLKEFLAGRGTLDIFMEALQHWLDADRAVHPERADQIAALEKHWLLRRHAEEVNRSWHDQGRISTKEYMRTKYARLETEIALRQALLPGERPFTATRGTLRVLGGADQINSKEVAQAKSRAAAADPKKLAEAKLQAILIAYESREKEFLAGRGTLHILLKHAGYVRDTELALASGEADRRAALEKYWVCTRRIDVVDRVRYEAGRIAIQDYLQARYYRLDAEIQLARAQAEKAGNAK